MQTSTKANATRKPALGRAASSLSTSRSSAVSAGVPHEGQQVCSAENDWRHHSHWRLLTTGFHAPSEKRAPHLPHSTAFNGHGARQFGQVAFMRSNVEVTGRRRRSGRMTCRASYVAERHIRGRCFGKDRSRAPLGDCDLPNECVDAPGGAFYQLPIPFGRRPPGIGILWLPGLGSLLRIVVCVGCNDPIWRFSTELKLDEPPTACRITDWFVCTDQSARYLLRDKSPRTGWQKRQKYRGRSTATMPYRIALLQLRR